MRQTCLHGLLMIYLSSCGPSSPSETCSKEVIQDYNRVATVCRQDWNKREGCRGQIEWMLKKHPDLKCQVPFHKSARAEDFDDSTKGFSTEWPLFGEHSDDHDGHVRPIEGPSDDRPLPTKLLDRKAIEACIKGDCQPEEFMVSLR